MDDRSLIDKVRPYTDVCNIHSQMLRESLTVDEILEKYPEYLSEDQIKLLRSMSKMNVEFNKGFQEQLSTGVETYAVDAINGVTHSTARPISEVIENMNTLNNNPVAYLVNTDNGGRPNHQMINDNGNYVNPDWQLTHWYPYSGPNNLSNNLQPGVGIREQINTANVNFPQPLTQNDVVERIMDLCNQEPPQQYLDNSNRVYWNARIKGKRNNEPDPSIVINEETGERFKWIDGKLVNLDEQDSTN